MTRFAFFVLLPLVLFEHASGQTPDPSRGLFAKDNLVAWCIVPFDAAKRGPVERAEMVHRLGLRRVAYDWRAEHVPTFEQEIIEYKRLGIEFFAFWSWHDELEPLIAKHQVRPQIWVTVPSPNLPSQDERVQAAIESLVPLAEKTKRLGLKLGLYNHGGWGGIPANMVAVCQRLRRKQNSDHIGLVYNFHHGHDHAGDFAASMKQMQPYLLCVNLNGMLDPNKFDVTKQQQKIRAIGSGTLELPMIKSLLESGYQGPVGILDHRNDLDSEQALLKNLSGLRQIQDQLVRE